MKVSSVLLSQSLFAIAQFLSTRLYEGIVGLAVFSIGDTILIAVHPHALTTRRRIYHRIGIGIGKGRFRRRGIGNRLTPASLAGIDGVPPIGTPGVPPSGFAARATGWCRCACHRPCRISVGVARCRSLSRGVSNLVIALVQSRDWFQCSPLMPVRPTMSMLGCCLIPLQLH